MNGMQMMLKQFGIDPVELQKNLVDGKQQAEEWLKKFDARLEAIELKLTRIEEQFNGGSDRNTGSKRDIDSGECGIVASGGTRCN